MSTRGKLSDRRCATAPFTGKVYRLWDGDGLSLEVGTARSKTFYFDFKRGGKQTRVKLGNYPRFSLADARAERDRLRMLQAHGRDPRLVREATLQATAYRDAMTFETAARGWYEDQRRGWKPGHSKKVWQEIEKHLLPSLGAIPLADVGPARVAALLRLVHENTPEMGRKLVSRIRRISDFAAGREWIEEDRLAKIAAPAAERSNGTKKQPAIVEAGELAARILIPAQKAFGAGRCEAGCYRAHLMVALTALRIGALVPAQFREIDFSGATWNVPRERMKQDDAARGPVFRAPLSRQALRLLRDWRKQARSDDDHIFAADPDGHIGGDTLTKFYRIVLGLRDMHTPHRWRHAVQTIAHESGKFDHFTIELQLDHKPFKGVAAHYMLGDYLDRRRRMAQWWADLLWRAAAWQKGRS